VRTYADLLIGNSSFAMAASNCCHCSSVKRTRTVWESRRWDCVVIRRILISEYNGNQVSQVAGRKKSGNLQASIGVRLDETMEEMISRVAHESPLGRGAKGEVIRIVVTAWILSTDDPIAAFEPLAKRVHAWRREYDAAERAGRAIGQARAAGRARRNKKAEEDA